ncbi:methylation-associated defense system restriction endonuclease subunit S MAD5 [Streptomyces lateritius]|uniref:methylation-associated defense system restriction endonuclease subunit S MAD5 n=1 Tax=Streptomyces lateritius TaxID=67313 RepID=UPI00167395B0|nr:restriction endonuclease subunit S [Streptomyces lateritius]GGU06908.1 type I restriction-modification system restriction endonuclease DNA specificity subunit HsdS [Streptomyces lateritius]
MKIASISSPVMSSWFAEQGHRLDAAPYVSGALKTKKLLERLPKTEPLEAVTTGPKGGLFYGPMFRRVYLTDPEYSVPWLGSRDMMAADLTGLPRLKKSDAESPALADQQLKPGMTLISRSGFYAGRRAYVRPDMGDCWASEHILKVQPNPEKIKSGYLYAFLLSRFGESLVRGSVYGSAVKHIEPHHIAGLPVPRFEAELEDQIHDLVEECARLRAEFQSSLVSATEDLFKSVGLPELIDVRWHQQERDLGFDVSTLGPTSLRALNFAPRARQLAEKLGSVPGKSLGEICSGGQLGSGVRFKRVDSNPEHGVQLIGQRQGFWLKPEGRWISAEQAPSGIFACDETIMIAAQGTLGENEVFCRPLLITGSWLKYVYTQHFLRVVSGDPEVPGAYLFAFFRSEAAFRLLRSLSVGGKQQDIHEGLRAQIPVPLAPPADRERIAATVRHAYECRDRADVLEDKALALLTTAIEEAAG